jgi:glutathione peroxidase
MGQYEGLEKLYNKYKNKDFVVLGFPCNQFMNQEPATNEEIKEFCSLTYDVSFPMFSKIDVNKFLIDKNGNIINRYSPSTTPKSLEDDIEKLL